MRVLRSRQPFNSKKSKKLQKTKHESIGLLRRMIFVTHTSLVCCMTETISIPTRNRRARSSHSQVLHLVYVYNTYCIIRSGNGSSQPTLFFWEESSNRIESNRMHAKSSNHLLELFLSFLFSLQQDKETE